MYTNFLFYAELFVVFPQTNTIANTEIHAIYIIIIKKLGLGGIGGTGGILF